MKGSHMKTNIKRFTAVCLTLVMAVALFACGTPSGNKTAETTTVAPATSATGGTPETTAAPQKQYNLKVAGIDGSLTLFPVYVAQEKGWFKEAGLNIERLGFTNGPVTMEAINTWDISVTGVGGVLSGLISYDAVLLGTVGTDDGTQYLFVRKDSPVAAAGKGKNKINPEIVGDAASWKGMSVNSTYGSVLHYLLLKTLDGFGLTIDDVKANWMDMPTANASFLAGEGDATCVSGEVSFKDDKKDFVVASYGPIADLGLQTNFVANPEAIKVTDTREAMKVFLEVFFKSVDWILQNQTEAKQYLIKWCEYAGNTIDDSVAQRYLTVDTYYTLEDNYKALHQTATNGGSYSRIQEQILGVLKFFIDTKSYQPGDDQKFLKDGHFDTTLIDEVYAKTHK